MKRLTMLVSTLVAAAGLLAVSWGGIASAATVLCTEEAAKCPAAKVDGTGTEIKMSSVSGKKLEIFTEFKTIECGKSTLNSKVTGTGLSVNAQVEELSFAECNCEVVLLNKGTLELESIASTANATVKSNGTELTVFCEKTIFGQIHCIYKTKNTDIGTLVGGTPAQLQINVRLLAPATNVLCTIVEGKETKETGGRWEAEYEVTSPKPLYVEPEEKAIETILCTEQASPCPTGKADGAGTEIKANLVSGAKSKLTTPYNNIECAKSSLTAKVASTGKTIGANVEGLSFEECNCEVKVLTKGTLQLEHIASTVNATVTSSNTEITTLCSTVTGSVHCIYKTTTSDLGTFEGGNPPSIKISGVNIPRLTTDTRCNEGTAGTKWDAEFEVTSPKPLYIEPE